MNDSPKEEQAKLGASWREANVPEGFTLVTVGDLVIDDVLSPRIAQRLQALSRAYGTCIETCDGVGVIALRDS